MSAEEDYLRVISALVRKYGSQQADEGSLSSRAFLGVREIERAEDLTLEVYKRINPWGFIYIVTDHAGKVNKAARALRNAFLEEVPTPSLVKEAYKQAYGVDLD